MHRPQCRKILECPVLSAARLLAGASPPNSRTERPLLRDVPVVAVRHRPITAPGARQVAAEGIQAGVDVRLFGETPLLAGKILFATGSTNLSAIRGWLRGAQVSLVQVQAL